MNPDYRSSVPNGRSYHSISHDWDLPDPDVTSQGEAQCAELASALPSYSSIDLIVCSPLRRTNSTTLLGLRNQINSRRSCHRTL